MLDKIKVALFSLFLLGVSGVTASAVTVSGSFPNPIPCNRFAEVKFTQTGTNAFSTFQFRTVNGCPGAAAYRGFRVELRLADYTGWDDLSVGFLGGNNTFYPLTRFTPRPFDPTILQSSGGGTHLLVSFTDTNAPATLGVALQPIPLPPAAFGLLAALAALSLVGSARTLRGAVAYS